MIWLFLYTTVLFLLMFIHSEGHENANVYKAVSALLCIMSAVLLVCTSTIACRKMYIQNELDIRGNPELLLLLESEYPKKGNESYNDYYARLKPKYTNLLKYMENIK